MTNLNIEPGTKCFWKDCKELATTLASGRSESFKIGYYCEEHARLVLCDGSPEYEVECPACGCRFGVN